MLTIIVIHIIRISGYIEKGLVRSKFEIHPY